MNLLFWKNERYYLTPMLLLNEYIPMLRSGMLSTISHFLMSTGLLSDKQDALQVLQLL